MAVYSGPVKNCLAGVESDTILYQSGRGEESSPGCYGLITAEQDKRPSQAMTTPKKKRGRRPLPEHLRLVSRSYSISQSTDKIITDEADRTGLPPGRALDQLLAPSLPNETPPTASH